MNTPLKNMMNQLTADKKKFGLMLSLMIIASVMWLRMALTGEESAPATAQAQTGLQNLVKDKSENAGLDTRPVVFVELSEQSQRNLFSVQTDKFARITKQTTQVPQNSVTEPSEEQKRTQAAEALKSLKLRSTLMSATPQALINDRLLSVGSQPVPGFVITRIGEYSVFLKHEQFEREFELKMYRDQ